jgi:hypothetical protein
MNASSSPVAFAANTLYRPVFLRSSGFLRGAMAAQAAAAAMPSTHEDDEADGFAAVYSARNQRELDGSRPSIFLKGRYRAVRKRQSAALTLSDHMLNLARQELVDLSGIIDLAAAVEKFPSDLLCFHEQLRVGIVPEPCRHRFSLTFARGTTRTSLGS